MSAFRAERIHEEAVLREEEAAEEMAVVQVAERWLAHNRRNAHRIWIREVAETVARVMDERQPKNEVQP